MAMNTIKKWSAHPDVSKTMLDERYSFIVCVNLCAHFLHVQKYERFSTVNVDVRKTSDQRQSKFVLCSLTELGLSQSNINGARSTHEKNKIII